MEVRSKSLPDLFCWVYTTATEGGPSAYWPFKSPVFKYKAPSLGGRFKDCDKGPTFLPF